MTLKPTALSKSPTNPRYLGTLTSLINKTGDNLQNTKSSIENIKKAQKKYTTALVTTLALTAIAAGLFFGLGVSKGLLGSVAIITGTAGSSYLIYKKYSLSSDQLIKEKEKKEQTLKLERGRCKLAKFH